MVVIDHAGLRARLLRDGVGEVLARGAAQVGELEVARELHRAIGLVLRGVEHLAVGVLQLERVFAALQLGVVREARRDHNDLGRRQLHGSLCGVGVREGGGIGLVTIVGNGGVQLASFVHDLHRGMVHRVVEGHVGQVALLLHDGVLVLAGLGVVDGREGDGAVLAVLGAPDGLLALQLLGRQIALVQVEGELAALERSRRAVGLHIGLLRRERHRGLGGLIRVLEGRDIVLAVVSDGRLRLVALRLHRDVNPHLRGIVGDGRIAASDLLERVVVLAQVQALDGQLDLAILIVGAASVLIAVLVVQAEGERIGRQVLARENFRGLNGDVRRRLRVGEGRHGLLTVVGDGRLQLALFVGDLDVDLHALRVVDDGRVGALHLLDGVVVVARRSVVDGCKGDLAVLLVLDSLDHAAVLVEQLEREVTPRELTAREALRRLERYRGLLRAVRVRDHRNLIVDHLRCGGAIILIDLLHFDDWLGQISLAVILHRYGHFVFGAGVADTAQPTGIALGGRSLGNVVGVLAKLLILNLSEAKFFGARNGLLDLLHAGHGRCRGTIRHRRSIGGAQAKLEAVGASPLTAGELLLRLDACERHRRLHAVAVGEHQLVVFGHRAVGILRGNPARDAIAFFSQILVTLLAAGQLIARGHLVCAGQLLHRVLVTLGETVHADRLVGRDGLLAAVLEVEHFADLLLACGPRVLKHRGLVRLPRRRGHGELEGEPRVRFSRQARWHHDLLHHLEARLAFVRHAHAGGARKQGVQIHVAQVGAGALRISVTRHVLRDAHTYPARLGLQAVRFVLLGGPILVDTSIGAVLKMYLILAALGVIVPGKVAVAVERPVGRLALALDPRERVVNVALCAKLAQALHERAHAHERRNAVINCTSIGVDAVIVHNHLDEPVIKQEAIGRRDLLQEVGTLHERLATVARRREYARPFELDRVGDRPRRQGVVGGLVAIEHGLAVRIRSHLGGLVKAELRPVNGLTLGIGLLHEQAILDVRDEQARGELPLEVRAACDVVAVHVDCVLRRRVADRARRCVVDGHRVLGILAGITAQQVVVLGDVTGQILNLYLVLAACVEREGVQVLLRRLDSTGHARLLGEGVSRSRRWVARHGVPIARIFDTCACAFVALEHHSEQYAGVQIDGLVGLRQVIICLVHGRRRGDGLLRGGERTGLPHDAARVHTAAVDDDAARAVLSARGHVLELHATTRRRETRAVSLGYARLLQEVVLVVVVILVVEIVEVDDAVVHVVRER